LTSSPRRAAAQSGAASRPFWKSPWLYAGVAAVVVTLIVIGGDGYGSDSGTAY
jgi:hypothetical protein